MTIFKIENNRIQNTYLQNILRKQSTLKQPCLKYRAQNGQRIACQLGIKLRGLKVFLFLLELYQAQRHFSAFKMCNTKTGSLGSGVAQGCNCWLAV